MENKKIKYHSRKDDSKNFNNTTNSNNNTSPKLKLNKLSNTDEKANLSNDNKHNVITETPVRLINNKSKFSICII